MCLPSWLYRSLHSGRVMGHGFLSFAAHLSFQNYGLKIRIGVKKKICATNFRTNILCKNWKMVGKAVAAAWNPSKRGCDTCAMRPGWLFTLFFLLLFCILFILCMVHFFLTNSQIASTTVDLSMCLPSHDAAWLHFDTRMKKTHRSE